MSKKNELTRPERKKGQKFALLTNIFTPVSTYVMVGALMILYAGDVLGLPVSKISRILALIPLVSLIRFTLIRFLSRIGKVRLIRSSTLVNGLVILTLIIIPSEKLSYGLYLSMLISYSLSSELGRGTAWQPLLKDITTNNDRGRFFSRMRLVFTLVSLVVTGVVPFIIGEAVSSLEYKILLFLPLLSQINILIMIKHVPELPPDKINKKRISFTEILRDLKLLSRPLLMIILVQCTFFPLFVLYLRQGLNMPSNLVVWVVFISTLGNAFSLLFWGQISDAVGFRNTITGVHLLGFLQIPFLLFIQPEAGLLMTIPALIGLFFYSFIDGVVMAGSGIAMTSIQHFFTTHEKSIFIFSVFSSVTFLVNALWLFLTGEIIGQFIGPVVLNKTISSIFYLDGVKLLIIIIAISARTLLFIMVKGLPNIQPWFGLGDFFTALNPASIRTMVQSGRLYRMDDREREQISHSLGHRWNPFGIHSLTGLLKDPSYDVKVSAIRELGRSGSSLAGKSLYPLLKNPNMAIYHVHIAWALGQLEWEEAAVNLLEFLTSERSEKLKAVSARALGKIGSPNAVPMLRELIHKKTPTFHLSSSACWALIHLDMEGSAELIFRALPLYHNSNIRYEIMDLLCPYLNISNLWILKYGQDQGGWRALLEHTEDQPNRWQQEKSVLINALSSMDYQAVLQQYNENFLWKDNTLSKTLRNILKDQKGWNPLFLLASAQMLLGE